MKNDRNKKRKTRTRSKFVGTGKRPRFTVYRSNKYIYAQLIDDEKGVTLLETKDISIKGKTKVDRASIMGEQLAKEALKKNIKSVVFDRGAYKYHGRVKAVAEGARKGGLKF